MDCTDPDAGTGSVLTLRRQRNRILHFIGYIDEAEVHVEGSPEGSGVLGLNLQDKGRIPFCPAAGGGAGIHLVGKFRLQGTIDLLRMIGNETKTCDVACQGGKPCSYYGRKEVIKLFSCGRELIGP